MPRLWGNYGLARLANRRSALALPHIAKSINGIAVSRRMQDIHAPEISAEPTMPRPRSNRCQRLAIFAGIQLLLLAAASAQAVNTAAQATQHTPAPVRISQAR